MEHEIELRRAIVLLCRDMEQLREINNLSVEWLKEEIYNLASKANRTVAPEHAAAIASELQFLRTTKHKANYMRRYMADKRAHGLNSKTTAPTVLSTSIKKINEEPNYVQLRACYTIEEGHEFLQMKDTKFQRLGRDILDAYEAERFLKEIADQAPSPDLGASAAQAPEPSPIDQCAIAPTSEDLDSGSLFGRPKAE